MSPMSFWSRPSRVRLVKPESGEMSSIWLFQSHSSVRLAKFESDEMSSMALEPSCSCVRLVKPESDEMLPMIELFQSERTVRLVKPESGEISVIELFSSHRFSRLVAYSSPVKSLMPASKSTLSHVKVSMSSTVIGAPMTLPKAAAIAALRLASGMATTGEGASLPKF